MSTIFDWVSSVVDSVKTNIMGERGVSSSAETSNTSWRMEDYSPADRRLNGSGESSMLSSAWDAKNRESLLEVLLEEYRQVIQSIPNGMVVAPAFHTLLEWHGIIFVNEGWFKGGVFKFVIHIPVDYPESPPAVYFFNRIFHPLVDSETGRLDLTPAFPTWKSGRDYLVLVLLYLKKIFLKKELNSFFNEMNRDEFLANCDECVCESLRLIYICHPNSPIPLSAWRHAVGSHRTSHEIIEETIENAAKQMMLADDDYA
jgi:ubiquitin-protein ligase